MPLVSSPTLVTSSAQVAPNSIEQSDLADDAVGLPEMTAGTAGNLITYDASGNPAAVATGTSGQVLTSGGAGVAPTFQATAAALTFKTGVITRATDAASGAVTTAHGVGASPKFVRIHAFIWGTAAPTGAWAKSDGAYDTTNTASASGYFSGDAGNSATTSTVNMVAIIWDQAGRSQIATIGVDSTNFTLTWTRTGATPAGTIQILWEAWG